MKKSLAILGMIAASALSGAPAHAENSTAGKRIALSNFYAGECRRQAMLQAWTDLANEAIKAGIIKDLKIVNANNSATEQASQIESLIVEGWDAIVVDPISTTAINSAIKDACDAGITVIVFNEFATAPCAKHILTNYVSVGAQQAEFFGQTLKGPNNILEIRGIAGTSADEDMHNGLVDGLKKYPNLKSSSACSTATGRHHHTARSRRRAAEPSGNQCGRDARRRRLRRIPGVQGRKSAHPADHHGPSPG